MYSKQKLIKFIMAYMTKMNISQLKRHDNKLTKKLTKKSKESGNWLEVKVPNEIEYQAKLRQLNEDRVKRAKRNQTKKYQPIWHNKRADRLREINKERMWEYGKNDYSDWLTVKNPMIKDYREYNLKRYNEEKINRANRFPSKHVNSWLNVNVQNEKEKDAKLKEINEQRSRYNRTMNRESGNDIENNIDESIKDKIRHYHEINKNKIHYENEIKKHKIKRDRLKYLNEKKGESGDDNEELDIIKKYLDNCRSNKKELEHQLKTIKKEMEYLEYAKMKRNGESGENDVDNLKLEINKCRNELYQAYNISAMNQDKLTKELDDSKNEIQNYKHEIEALKMINKEKMLESGKKIKQVSKGLQKSIICLSTVSPIPLHIPLMKRTTVTNITTKPKRKPIKHVPLIKRKTTSTTVVTTKPKRKKQPHIPLMKRNTIK